jgi:glycosyltransferase involved in cell wall biosynthesis
MSTDGTSVILDKYVDCIDTLIIEQDEGLYFAMNKGINLARGKFVSFLNSDDYYLENSLSHLLDILESEDEHSLVTDILLIDKNQRLHVPINEIDNRMIPHPGLFMTKEAIVNLGGFDTEFQVAADYELVSKALRHGHKFKNTNKLITAHRSGGFSQKQRQRSIIETYRVQIKYYKKSIWKNTLLFMKCIVSGRN